MAASFFESLPITQKGEKLESTLVVKNKETLLSNNFFSNNEDYQRETLTSTRSKVPEVSEVSEVSLT